MRRLRGALAAGLGSALFACRTGQPRPEVPARIVDPTEQSRAALARAVSAALGGAPVTLADDALTRGSALLVERAWVHDPAGLPANGRRLGAPERFRLVESGGACILVHEGTGRRYPLAATACSPAGDLP